METFDVVVIGSGPGGYPAAIRAAQLGARVAIVEREQVGGTCLNWGCIPTKTLIAAASVFSETRHAAALGISVQGAAVDFPGLARHKAEVVGQLQKGVKQLLKANGVTVFMGSASFEARGRIRVTPAAGEAGAEPVTIGAAKTIIATGSTSAVPGFVPRHERVVESKAFLAMERFPSTLLVLGGGYIGCELACMAAQLGSKVTIVELLEDILVQLDADLRRELRRHMEKDLGMRILTGKALENIKAGASGVEGMVGDETVKADCLLVSVGRKPVTDGLALEKVGLKTDERGYIPVDEYGRTKAAGIYAIGDVTGGIQLAHAATSQGITAAENACRKTLRKNETLVPSAIFTTPELGTAGISENQAREKGLKVKTGKFIFRALGRAVAAGHVEGFVKWIADAETGQLLGAAAVGPHATDLIAEAALAIRSELTVEEMARTIHVHPTFPEIWMEAAHAVQGEAIHAPPPR